MLPPKPYRESDVSDQFWGMESFDELVPQGFLSDLVLAGRPLETPTFSQLWAGLWLISSAIKRAAYLEPVPLAEPMYPNLYVAIVGPPRVVGKSTIIGIVSRILAESNQYLTDPRTRADRRPNIIRSRTTAVGLLSDRLILPDSSPLRTPVRLPDGSFYTPPSVAQGALVASELGVLVGNQKYLEDLVGNLTDLYDSKSIDEMTTKARGTEVLEKVYLTIIGATTQKALAESFPATAFGDGFLSRMVLVPTLIPTRVYPEHQRVSPAPDVDELARRLAWVIWNAEGRFDFSDDAQAMWNQLYREHRSDLIENLYDPDRSVDFRWDIHLRKLSLLLRAARYEPGQQIEVEDLQAAYDLLMATLNFTRDLMRGVGLNEDQKNKQRVMNYLKSHDGGLTRKKLSQYTSRDMNVKEMNGILNDLLVEKRIRVMGDRQQITKNGAEVYRWVL